MFHKIHQHQRESVNLVKLMPPNENLILCEIVSNHRENNNDWFSFAYKPSKINQ